MRPVTPGTGIRWISCNGASSWDGAEVEAGTPPGAVLQLMKVKVASTRNPTSVKRIFISFPPVKSDISDSHFEQKHASEFQNKNLLFTPEVRILESLLLPYHWQE